MKVRDEPDRHTVPFLTETLRLTPAVWGIPRTPTKAGLTLTADGVTARVRRGEVATVYLRGINRDPGIWPDPSRFDPSRHDRAATERQRALLPFGLGPRGCIGQHLALAEMSAVLPALRATREHRCRRQCHRRSQLRASHPARPQRALHRTRTNTAPEGELAQDEQPSK